MKTPSHWRRGRSNPGLIARLLWPLSLIWGAVAKRNLRRDAWQKMPLPVICVGNLTAGGTGKTPVAIHLMQYLRDKGINAHVVSRGHNGTEEGPVRVVEGRHTAAEVGDEPLLIAAFGPVWVAKDRDEGIRAAYAEGAEAIILDDGLQNPAIAKDLSIIVVDAAAGFGNGWMIPAGPMREPLASGLKRGDLILSIGPMKAQERLSAEWPEIASLPRSTARIVPLETGMDWNGTRVLAFAGIGRPEKFFASLRSLDAELVATREFGDHEPLSDRAFQRLLKEAASGGAQLVTTEKDAVRLEPAQRRQVMVLPVRLRMEDDAALGAALSRLGF